MSVEAARVAAPVRRWRSGRARLTFVLCTAFVISLSVVVVQSGGWHPGGFAFGFRLLRSVASPDLSPAFLLLAAEAALVTVSYAVSGMSLAIALGLPGALLVSGVMARHGLLRNTVVVASRAVFGAIRAVHELVWALVFLILLGPVPLAGVLAIGLPYGATIARVLGERLQDVPDPPLEALRTAGARRWQLLFYGRIPLASADGVAYLWYRFECALRSAAVLSFIGLGGIGYRIQIALADLRFGQVWTLLAVLVLLILALDRMSGRIRHRLVV